MKKNYWASIAVVGGLLTTFGIGQYAAPRYSAAVPPGVRQEAPLYNLIHRINRERTRTGARPLRANGSLMKTAQAHAEDMARRGYFAHSSPEGVQPWQRVEQAGYRYNYVGENIVLGARTADMATKLWMDSPGHRSNILDGKFVETGVGIAAGKRGVIMVQVFGRSNETMNVVIENELPITTRRNVNVTLNGFERMKRMRHSLDGAEWSTWRPYSSSANLYLPGPKGMTVVYVQVESETGNVITVFDSIFNDSDEPAKLVPTGDEASTRQVMGGDMRVLQDQGNETVAPEMPKWPLDKKGVPIVPLVFPVLGPVKWSDTFGAPRDGGKRKHMGQDLPAEKMRPLVAAISGTVYMGGDTLSIQGDNGVACTYIHLNNDLPGTDDGKAGPEFTFAPGLKSGDRVEAGQFVGYNGDSGNAEQTIPHLHFELHVAGYGTVNAYSSLMRAQKIQAAKPVLMFPDTLPGGGMKRIDLHFERFDAEKNQIYGFVISETEKSGKTKMVTKPQRKVLNLGPDGVKSVYLPTEAIDLTTLAPGDRIVVIGKSKPGRDFDTAIALADKPSASSTTIPTVIDPSQPGRR